MSHAILIMGAGKIGAVIAHILASSGDYNVHLADLELDTIQSHIPNTTREIIKPVAININDHDAAKAYIEQHKIGAIVSCLPYFCNQAVAQLAKATNIHYFDLTEDVNSVAEITELSKGAQNAFVPQCGLAPGLIDIAANDLMQHFDTLETAKLRCGALPENASNPLQYALTWSTDGLINEYGNACHAVNNYKTVSAPGLSELEEIQIDGLSYEAFNTSGGLGSLAETYEGKVKRMNYKSVRYPGHCEKMRFLMYGLHLNEDRDTLKRILETSIPSTFQDVVLVYVSVNGKQDGRFMKEDFVRKFYPIEINGKLCAAIQLTTATSACAIIDIVMCDPSHYHGRVKQEQFSLSQVLSNRFGNYLSQE